MHLQKELQEKYRSRFNESKAALNKVKNKVISRSNERDIARLYQ